MTKNKTSSCNNIARRALFNILRISWFINEIYKIISADEKFIEAEDVTLNILLDKKRCCKLIVA